MSQDYWKEHVSRIADQAFCLKYISSKLAKSLVKSSLHGSDNSMLYNIVVEAGGEENDPNGYSEGKHWNIWIARNRIFVGIEESS